MCILKNKRKLKLPQVWFHTVITLICLTQNSYSSNAVKIEQVDTMYLDYGDSLDISGVAQNLSQWSSAGEFRQLNTNSIRVSPQTNSTYVLKNFTRKTVVNENPSFETPKIGRSWTLRHQDQVPGWKTTATDRKIEIWTSGFLGVKAFDGNQFAELNANTVSYTHLTLPTTD